jgi:hypothetical protein
MLTIECWDQASGEPVPREAAGFAESGRGLAIIDYLANGAWGWHPAIGQRAKCVWAQIPLRATTRDYLSFVVTGRNRPADQPTSRRSVLCLAEPPISSARALSPTEG